VNETSSIVNVAQSIVRRVIQSGELNVIDKGTNDLQTKADRAAQNYIITKLSSLFPKVTIIGEEGEDISESYENLLPTDSLVDKCSVIDVTSVQKDVPDHVRNILEEDLVIWVDPLDGTAEFAKGITEGVTVLVGFASQGKSVAGVIGQPFYQVDGTTTGRTIWGIPGVGFGGINAQSPPKDKKVITTTRSHSDARVEAVLTSVKPDEVLRVGGAGYKVLLLIEGRANAYVYARAGCKKWDSCAPEAVLCAVGGNLTDLAGKNYEYHKEVQHINEGGILATADGEDHEWYVQQVAQVPG
jgi:3'(2'), 5'-bisphosphate nucleotidase